jgi:iron(III) transport system substrate-binding protein
VHAFATATHLIRGVFAAALVSGFLAGCGSPLGEAPASGVGLENRDRAQAAYDDYAHLSGADRETKLAELAKAEGELNLYGTDSLRDVGNAFSQKYGIKLNFYEADTDSLVSRIVQEAEAGKYSADVFNGGGTLLEDLDRNELLGSYESLGRGAVPADGKGEHWTAYRRQPFLVVYNVDEVNPRDIPKDVLGFADPRWQGKISMELGDYDWYMTLVKYYEEQGMSRQEVDAKFIAIAKNAVVVDGHSDQSRLLAAGQFGVAMSGYIHHAIGLQHNGAPVTFGGGGGNPTVQPVVMRYEGIALMAHAPHPAAATLFLDFVLGPDGTELTQKEGQLPAVELPDDPLAGSTVLLIDNDEYVNNGDEWSRSYDEILRDAKR